MRLGRKATGEAKNLIAGLPKRALKLGGNWGSDRGVCFMAKQIVYAAVFTGNRFRSVSLFLLTLFSAFVIGESAVYSQCTVLPPTSPTALTISTGAVPASIPISGGSGLVAQWKFDEGSGTIACDSSGNGNTATLVNGPLWAAGIVGNALYFDGVNDNVVVAASNSLNLSGSFTLSAWVNPASSATDFRSILAKNYKYYLYASAAGFCGNGSLIGGIYDGGDKVVCQASPLVPNTWTYLTLTYNGSMLTLYRNGVAVASSNISAALSASTGTLQIGASQYGEYFQGLIDEVRIYSTVLSAPEIQAIYQQESIDASQTVASPVISPTGGTYIGSTSVTMQTATSGAAIYYTTNGSTPSQSSLLYSGPMTLASSAVVRAKAFKSGYNASAEAGASFTVIQAFDFSLSSSGDKSVTAGSSVTNSISVSLASGSSQPVSFSVSGLPPGATASFSPASCSPNCSTVLTINTAGSTTSGSSPITVTATGGGVIRTTVFILSVALNATPALGKVYYVAKNGSDSNSCAQAQNSNSPKATIPAGINCMSGGDRLEIKAGTYEAIDGQHCPPSGSSWEAATTITRYASDAVTVGSITICDQGYGVRSYIIFDGLTIDANDQPSAIWIGNGAHHIRVTNSTICCASSVPIQTSISSPGSNEFTRNYIYNFTDPNNPVGSHALYLGSRASLVEFNEITNFGGACVQVYTGDSNRTDNTVIRYNWCHDGSGANTQGVQGASWAFILANGDNLQAYGNLITNLRGRSDGCCGTIGVSSSASNAKVYNNTLYNNASFGIGLSGGSGHQVKNNILWQNCRASACGYATTEFGDGDRSTGSTISNNVCTSSITGCSVVSNPLFLDPISNNFRLQSGSPAINKGADLTSEGISRDFDGVSRPQGSAFDIGAFEYVP